MKKHTIKLLGIVCLLLAHLQIRGQGCSDAGVCTAPSLHSAQRPGEYQNTVKLAATFGAADEGTAVFSPTLYMNWAIAEKTQLQARLPYHIISGDLADVSGLGDITLNIAQQLYNAKGYQVQASAGIKLPTNDADKTEDGRPLPMVYQTSLGTVDLLLGASVNYKQWMLGIGYQQPLTDANKNGFLTQTWIADQSFSDAREYENSRDLERKGDLVLRVQRNFKFRKLNLSASLLPILHLGKDSYLDASGTRREIDGSDGLTLNATVNAAFKLAKHIDLNVLLASPLAVRDHRPDGLTRAFVISPSLTYRF
ncbi:MAG: hypothetical protein MI784_16950 [Cytophagales bacterium]|nr:hypothetical protein [Cytophagales bacterium]